MSWWQLSKRFIPLTAVFLLLFTGCASLSEPGVLNPQGPVGQDQLSLILLSLAIMVLVVIVVFALFFYVLIRYRKRPGQMGIPKQIEGNHKLELLWTIIPLILLFILAIPTVIVTFNLAEDYSESRDAVNVKVTAHQFWWEFEYKDHGVITAQELVIPTNKKIQFELVTLDVNHSFWVPALGGKMDHTAGVTNRFFLQADNEGTFRGKCAEFCGQGHALMNFNVKAISKAEFDIWIQDMQGPTNAISEELERGYEVYAAKCIGCHAISTDLGGLGPNLAGFANRDYVAVPGLLENNAQNIREWILDPLSIKPGNKMPQIPLTDEEMNNLVLYLQSLK